MLQTVESLIDDARVFIYDRNMFKIPAQGLDKNHFEGVFTQLFWSAVIARRRDFGQKISSWIDETLKKI